MHIYRSFAPQGPTSHLKKHKVPFKNCMNFGTLVLILPTPHDGGEIDLSFGGRYTWYSNEPVEWKLDKSYSRYDQKAVRWDPSLALKQSANPAHSIAYIAFYTDVESAVLPITRGHRITVTYHLYFHEISNDNVGLPADVATTPQNVHRSSQILESLLSTHSFFPDGGVLAFGLTHEYPALWSLQRSIGTRGILEKSLRGQDAATIAMCKKLGLDVSFQVVYRDRWDEVEVMCTSDWLPAGKREQLWDRDQYYPLIVKKWGGVVVGRGRKDALDSAGVPYPRPKRDLELHWMTEKIPLRELETAYYVSDEESKDDIRMALIEGICCIVVKIGPPGKRGAYVAPEDEDLEGNSDVDND